MMHEWQESYLERVKSMIMDEAGETWDLSPFDRRSLIGVHARVSALTEALTRTLAGIEVALVEPERAAAILESLHDELAVLL